MELEPTRVILHCSATPDYPDNSKKYDLFGVADIEAWHIERGFNGVGYHYVIRRNGKLELGRDIKKIGAHCKGENGDSIGVCLIGTRWPTKEQIATLLGLYDTIKDSLGIDANNWFGHNEFTDKKTCPGFSMILFRELLQHGTRNT